MAFCSNCGKEIQDGAAFCASCGKPVAGTAPQAAPPAPPPPQEAEKPRTVKVGQVKKCPACGASIESFQTRCPSCGHELNSIKASGLITEFSEKILEFDAQILAEKTKPGLFIKTHRTWFIYIFACIVISIFLGIGVTDYISELLIALPLLCIFFIGIPFGVIKLKRTIIPTNPPLFPTEQQKKSYIENFVVPNTREDIMEFVLFSSTRVDSLLEHSRTSANDLGAINMWAKIWADKCNQVYSRAGIALEGDTKTKSQIDNLLAKPQKMLETAKKKALFRAGLFTAIVAVVAVLVVTFVIIPTSGIGIKVPAAKTLEAEDLRFTGSLDSHFRVISASLTPNKDGSEVTIAMEVEAVKSFADVVERKIAERKKENGWENDNVSSELYMPEITIGNFHTSYSERSAISSLLGMNTGDVKNFYFILTGTGSKGSKKKMVVELMNMLSIPVGSRQIRYQLTNNTKKGSGASYSGYNLIVDF